MSAKLELMSVVTILNVLIITARIPVNVSVLDMNMLLEANSYAKVRNALSYVYTVVYRQARYLGLPDVFTPTFQCPTSSTR